MLSFKIWDSTNSILFSYITNIIIDIYIENSFIKIFGSLQGCVYNKFIPSCIFCLRNLHFCSIISLCISTWSIISDTPHILNKHKQILWKIDKKVSLRTFEYVIMIITKFMTNWMNLVLKDLIRASTKPSHQVSKKDLHWLVQNHA
jgi:hypothetical protein